MTKSVEQQGFALLTVLLVVALVSMIASNILYQQRLDIQRSAYLLNQSQAIAVAAGIDAWVKKGLAFDVSQNKVDHLGELWALPMLPMAFEGGTLGGQLKDLQGRFNLNNLLEADSAKQQKWRDVLERTLLRQQLSIDWVAPLIDWLDNNNDPISGGAESDVYLLKTPPYRAANQPLVMLDELALLQGFDITELKASQAWLSVLPTTTTINVNTAEMAVLLGLAEWMNESIVQAWLEMRVEQPAANIDSFRLVIAQISGLNANQVASDLPDWMLSVKTDYFQLDGLVEYGVAKLNAKAMYYRKNQQQVFLMQRWIAINDE